MIKTIRDKIVTLLNAVDDIKAVYKYPKLKAEGYPYCWVVWKDQESSELTNTQDSVIYEFEISMIQEKIEDFKGREDAEDTTIDRAYTISNAFRAKNSLDLAGVVRTMPIKVVKEYVDNNTRIQIKVVLAVQTVETVI
jgi:hypothetical protein